MKKTKKVEYKTDNAFWDMLKAGGAKEKLASCIINSERDLSELMIERAQNLMEQARVFNDEAW